MSTGVCVRALRRTVFGRTALGSRVLGSRVLGSIALGRISVSRTGELWRLLSDGVGSRRCNETNLASVLGRSRGSHLKLKGRKVSCRVTVPFGSVSLVARRGVGLPIGFDSVADHGSDEDAGDEDPNNDANRGGGVGSLVLLGINAARVQVEAVRWSHAGVQARGVGTVHAHASATVAHDSRSHGHVETMTRGACVDRAGSPGVVTAGVDCGEMHRTGDEACGCLEC